MRLADELNASFLVLPKKLISRNATLIPPDIESTCRLGHSVTSAYFVLSALSSLIFSLMFVSSGNNIVVPVLAHGATLNPKP